MRTRTWLFMTVALASVLSMLFLLPAAAQDGRGGDAKPGPASTDPAAGDPGAFTGWDGDGPAPRTLVHSGDSTIQGGLCVGFDCSSNEPMGFATIKIEENNLRIAAADSSTVSGFPTTDWQIEFNSSSSGGGNYFMVRDCGSGGAAGSVDSTCGGTPMLTIEGGADNESIHVDSSGNQGGNVGFGTANPVVDLHALSGNTPTLRLEQDNSSGFTPQSWDMAGNESNFFIRDVTNGSALPFRIEPGTASNTLYLDNQERVGIHTTSPQALLHIRNTTGADGLLVDGNGNAATVNVSGATGTQVVVQASTGAGADLLRLENNGAPQFVLEDTNAASPAEWRFGLVGSANPANNKLEITAVSGGSRYRFFQDGRFDIRNNAATIIFDLDDNGDLDITGDLTANGTLYASDVRRKTNFRAVDAKAILEGIRALDVSMWEYRNRPGVDHIGPTAQDFAAAFGLGDSVTRINAVDMNGVTLAAVKALADENAALVDANAALEARVSNLEAQLAALLDALEK